MQESRVLHGRADRNSPVVSLTTVISGRVLHGRADRNYPTGGINWAEQGRVLHGRADLNSAHVVKVTKRGKLSVEPFARLGSFSS